MNTDLLVAVENIDKAVELLKSGQIVALHTDTVYGLTVFAKREFLPALNEAKNNPQDKPAQILCSKHFITIRISEYPPKRNMPQPKCVRNDKVLTLSASGWTDFRTRSWYCVW